jgi:hypothetical protein
LFTGVITFFAAFSAGFYDRFAIADRTTAKVKGLTRLIVSLGNFTLILMICASEEVSCYLHSNYSAQYLKPKVLFRILLI